MSHWLYELLNGIAGSLFMLVPGVAFLIRPDIVIKAVKTTRPEFDPLPSTTSTIRVVAGGFIFIGLLIAIGTLDRALR